MRRNPEIIFSVRIRFRVFFKNPRMEWTKNERIINGSAMPDEKMARRRTPCETVSWLPARKRMEVSMGPMQGVHPAANAMPIKNVPTRCSGFSLTCSLFSNSRALILMMPRRCSPKIMMTPPPKNLKTHA